MRILHIFRLQLLEDFGEELPCFPFRHWQVVKQIVAAIAWGRTRHVSLEVGHEPERATHEVGNVLRFQVTTKQQVITCKATHWPPINHTVFPFRVVSEERGRKMLYGVKRAGVDHRHGEQETVNTYKDGEGAALHTVSAPEGADVKEVAAACPGTGVCLGWDVLGTENLLPEGHQLGAAELLFAKIEDEAIKVQTDRLDAIRAAREAAEKAAAANQVAPQKDEVEFDDFGKMDIRTATVLEAVKVPKSDKLLKLTIDTGIDKRVIVSGIAKFYTPEEMLGKQICILANLKPRTIFGIESKGMRCVSSLLPRPCTTAPRSAKYRKCEKIILNLRVVPTDGQRMMFRAVLRRGGWL